MQRRILVLLCLVTVLAMLVGCAAPAAPAPGCRSRPRPLLAALPKPPSRPPPRACVRSRPRPPKRPPPLRREKTYVEALALTNLPYFIDHRLGLEFAGKVLNAKTKFVGPVDYDMTAMVNTMEQAMAENPQGMNVVGFDAALKPAIDKSIEQGIPTVTLDAEVYGSKRMTFLGTGNYNAGRVGGKMLAELIGGKGKVAILTKVGQSNLEERIQGYKDEIAENYPDVEIVQIIDDQSDSAKAADGLKAVLQRYPDLAGVGCVEAAGGVGAATASKELGLAGKLKIVSMDRDDGTLKFIEDGVIDGSVAQKSALMTFFGTVLMDGLQYNPVPIVSDNKAAGVKVIRRCSLRRRNPPAWACASTMCPCSVPSACPILHAARVLRGCRAAGPLRSDSHPQFQSRFPRTRYRAAVGRCRSSTRPTGLYYLGQARG